MYQKGLEQAPFDTLNELHYSNLSQETQSDNSPSDQLPDVLSLSNDIDYILSDFSNSRYRMNITLEYLGHLKSSFNSGDYSLRSEGYAKEQILPRLYVDSAMLIASRQKHQSLSKNISSRKGATTFSALKELIEAKIDFQNDIAEYVNLNPDKSSLNIYHNLALLMHQSRRAIYGDSVSSKDARQQNLSQLSGILAEHKVLSSLREDWPTANFGSVENDIRGTDVVIPSASNPQRGRALQIKSNRKPDCRFNIRDFQLPIPVLIVPMDLSRNDPLRLSQEDAQKMKKYVQRVPQHALAA